MTPVPAREDSRCRRHWFLLLNDRARRDRYFTVDRWESELAYRDFRRELAQAYDELDRSCEGLTIRETVVGEFDE